jgi:hypothetical protein
VRAVLASGCSIIVKAPEETPASPAELTCSFVDAGVLDGAVNLVYEVVERLAGAIDARHFLAPSIKEWMKDNKTCLTTIRFNLSSGSLRSSRESKIEAQRGKLDPVPAWIEDPLSVRHSKCC